MPSRNVIKTNIDADNSYYHVYARGSSKQPIFLDENDFTYFIGLFDRYLSPDTKASPTGMIYPNFSHTIELLAYCQMTNHFHLLFYQEKQGTLPHFMRSFMTSYSRYFNLRHKRSGPLFESRYKAALIDDQTYLEHISRYIHLNPRYWKRYPHSSLPYYIGAQSPEWINPNRILEIFESKQKYLAFLEDYEDNMHMLDKIKHSLADQ